MGAPQYSRCVGEHICCRRIQNRLVSILLCQVTGSNTHGRTSFVQFSSCGNVVLFKTYDQKWQADVVKTTTKNVKQPSTSRLTWNCLLATAIRLWPPTLLEMMFT